MNNASDRALLAKLIKDGKRASGKTWAAIASDLGMSEGHLKRTSQGGGLPSDERAIALAEYFSMPAISGVVDRIRGRECERCGAEYRLPKHGAQQRFCSANCQNRSQYEKHKRPLSVLRGIRTELADAQARVRAQSAAIAAFCRECEPGGVCRDASCALQSSGVSPLRLDSRLADWKESA